jgi:signal transduction histidine kinase
MDIKILLLEDIDSDADLVIRQLRRDKLNFVSERADTRETFVNALFSFEPDVVLSDHSMPQFDSLTALEIVKKERPRTPFILVTGSVSEEFAVTCIKSGADDYILKSNLIRLSSSIKSSLEKRFLESENNIIRNLNWEIEQKNEELDFLNQEKDRFMSIVSHDLQNHISSIMLSLGQLGKNVKGLSAKQWRHIKQLNRSAINTQKLLSDFLTVNRIQNGVINPVYSLVNMGNLVDEVVERYEQMAIKKGIKMRYRNNCKESFFRTDMSYLSIIADNLVSNAVKYTDGGKCIHIKVSKTNGKYKLEVKNEGPTIPENELPNLYKRFHKLSTRPTGGEPSNGLGLSIVKDLVGTLNATIDCESGNGQTTFTVTFN